MIRIIVKELKSSEDYWDIGIHMNIQKYTKKDYSMVFSRCRGHTDQIS